MVYWRMQLYCKYDYYADVFFIGAVLMLLFIMRDGKVLFMHETNSREDSYDIRESDTN